VLADLEITSYGSGTPRVHLYRSLLGTWTKVQQGHVIPVKEHATILLKALNVSVCLDFDRHVDAASQVSNPLRFRHNLQRERLHIASQKEHRFVSAVTPARKRLSFPIVIVISIYSISITFLSPNSTH
jgi:hypothetical protein